MALWSAATTNAFNTTLNGNIGSGDASITLTSATGLQFPGVIVVDRINAQSTLTPTVREYISFTGISTNTLTGCSRGLGGSTAQSHSSGAIIEECITVTHWNDLISAIENILTSGGALDTTKVMDLSTIQTATNKTFTAPTITNPTVTGGGSLAGTFTGNPTFSGNIPFTGKPVFTASQPTIIGDSDGATITFNMNSGAIHKVTLGGNRTLAVSNVSNPQAFVIFLKQDGTGSRTVTWWSGILWPNDTAPTLTTTAGQTDVFGFIYDGTSYWGSIIQQNS